MANELKDAIADANRIRTLAVENAKAAIQETFQPQIQRMISTKLSEEDDFASEDDLSGVEFEPAMGENGDAYIDDHDDGTPANNLPENADDGGMQITEEELDSMIRELESEDEFGTEDEFATDEFSAEGGDEFAAGSEGEFGAEGGMEFGAEGGEGEFPAEEEFPEDDVIETVMKQIQTELAARRNKNAKAAPATASKQSVDITKLQRENAKLRGEVNEVRKANVVLKTAVNEVNLLNAKLMYASKLVRGFVLSDAQHANILESLDRSKTTREAELIYKTLVKQFAGATRSNAAAQPQRNKLGATKPITEGKAPKTGNEYEFAGRWKVLAGLGERNY